MSNSIVEFQTRFEKLNPVVGCICSFDENGNRTTTDPITGKSRIDFVVGE